MAELETLRARVEKVNVDLKSAHASRESESEGLMALWQQISTRFAEQNQELARLRQKCSEMEDAKDELSSMVRTLLDAIETTTEEINDRTMPQISNMAKELLGAGPDTPATSARPDRAKPAAEERPTDPMPAALAPVDLTPAPPVHEAGIGDTLSVGESLSPGIRNLISRVGGVFDKAEADDDPEPDHADTTPYDDFPEASMDEVSADTDDDLARDMREIEKLRTELQGLRQRINTPGE